MMNCNWCGTFIPNGAMCPRCDKPKQPTPPQIDGCKSYCEYCGKPYFKAIPTPQAKVVNNPNKDKIIFPFGYLW